MNHLKRVPTKLFPARAVGQELSEDFFQFLRVANLHSGVLRDEAAHHVRKVLHVRPKDSRFAKRARFDWILSPFRREALAHEDHIRVLIEKFQLARSQSTPSSIQKGSVS